MAPTISSSSAVDGLISGLDTASIISKLVSVDAAPQTAMKNSVSAAQTRVSTYQSVNSKMAALQAAAANLTQGSAWTAATATSSTDGVTVTAGASALPGSLNTYVNQLATGRTVIFTQNIAKDDKDAAQKLGFPLDVVSSEGKYLGTVDVNTGTLEEVAAAINKASSTIGISAVALRISDGVYRLQITSTKTGSAGDFSFAPKTGANVAEAARVSTEQDLGLHFTEFSQAQNAELYVVPAGFNGGDDVPPGSVLIRSSTNTFTDLMAGVTATVTKKGAARIDVASDPSKVSASMQSLVAAANAALDSIGAATRPGTIGADGANSGAGALSGNSTLRTMRTAVVAAVTSALGGTTSAAQYGLQSTRDGKLTFDSDVFLKAYQADPAKAQKLLAPTSVDPTSKDIGVVEGLLAVTKAATGIDPLTKIDSKRGSLFLAIEGQNSTITDLTKRISDWDTRLATKKAYYQKYYANLEVALGKLQSQSSWLSGQLANLSKS